MVRRLVVRGLASAAIALGVFAAMWTSVACAATATQLLLPQGTAFAILGHSCGGIQEKAYATGFDSTTGNPTGVVLMSTSCGGSGRGGGYHTTLYSASAGVTWDLTGSVVSYVAPAPSVTVNPTFSAYDTHGNEVYNQSGSAFLVLASGFTPAPRVTAVTPSIAPTTGGTTVTITGTGFTRVTAVEFGTTAAASFTVTGSTSVTAVAPAASAGTVDVTVVNAGGPSATSASDQFTFVAAPSVTGVSPGSGSPAGGTAVTISGSHLGGATRVAFGGTPAGFTVNSASSITATSPGTSEAGTVDVKVTTPGGTSARTTADRFTYTVSRPVVTAISPSSGSVDGGTEVTITGSNLSSVGEVDFGGVGTYFAVNDDTSITAYAPPASAGTVDVTVVAYGLRSATKAADRFTFLPAPTVSAVSPATGPIDGGTSVTISGANFTGASEVDFGGVPASFTLDSSTSITAVTPAGSAGPVDVTVTATSGTSAPSADDVFTYADSAPTVTGVSPNEGPTDGNALVLIGGTDLTNTIEVDFGGISVPFAVLDDNTVLALSPGGSPGSVDITVTTDGGTSATGAADLFTYVPAPTVSGVSPATGPASGGTIVTITGTDLTGAVEVDFGGVPADFTANGDGSITAAAPAGTAGAVDITVTTGGGTSAASAADQFSYV